jgi:hypothetical protein
MNPVDTAFCLQALNARIILLYIATKLKAAFTERDNLAIFEALLTILNRLKDNGECELARGQRQKRMVIVD